MPALPTGQRNGVAVLDLDCKNGKDGMAELRKLGFDPDSMSPIIVQSPSGGRHVYFRLPDGMGNSAEGLPPGVDVRGEGGFVVAPGAVNGKGTYTLLSGDVQLLTDTRDLGGLPDWPDDLRPFRRAPEASDGEPTGLPLIVIESALMACPNDGGAYDSRDEWLRMVMAIHAETGGSEDGRTLAHEWSAQHPTYDATGTDALWDSAKAEGGVTGWHIIHEARRHGWRDAAVEEMLAQDVLADLPEPDDTLADFGVEPKAPTLTFLSPSECAAITLRPYVVKGLLGQGDIGAIIGAPGAGKSLLGPRLAYAVAQGQPVFGLKVRQGKVFYIAAEDTHGMQKRLAALRGDLGEAEDLRLVTGVSDLLSKGGQLKELVAAVKAERPSLVIIDTLAVAFPGLEENDAKGMGTVVAAAKALAQWGAAVVLIHHDTKDGRQGLPRGHSLLNGALDMALYLKREEDGVIGKPSKNRNGTTERTIAFTIGSRTVGTDEDGDPITAPIAEEANAKDVKASGGKLTPSATATMAIFRGLSEGTKAIGEDVVREAVIDSRTVSAAEDRDSRRKAYKRAIEELTRNGILIYEDGRFRENSSPRDDFADLGEET